MSKTLLELQDDRKVAMENIETISNNCETEKRSMNDEERTSYDDKIKAVEDIDRDIKVLELKKEEERGNTNNYKKIENENMNKRTFADQINEAISNKSDEAIIIPVEHRKFQNSEMEIRTSIAKASDSVTVDTTLNTIIEDLQAELTYTQLGAEFITGIKDNQSWPVLGHAEAHWLKETDEVPETVIDGDMKHMKPKRLATSIVLSKRMLKQDSKNVEAYVKREIINAIKTKLNATVLSDLTETESNPAGVLNGLSPVMEGDVISYDALVDMETSLDDVNALLGSPKYVTNGKGVGALKKTFEKPDGTSNKLLMNGEANGYPVLRDNVLPTTFGTGNNEFPVLLANFSDLMLGQWGDIELIYDPFTKVGSNQVRFIVESDFGMAKKHDESFSYATFTL